MRTARAAWRDSFLLLRQFRWPLFLLLFAVIIGGLLYHLLSQAAGEPTPNLAGAMYSILGMMFFNAGGPFPNAWYLELFYFVMPLFGIGILAHGIAEFGVLFFNRRARSKEWEMAVASTFSNHIILVGLGHLGFRVVRDLHQLDQDVVVIEQNPKAHLLDSVHEMNIPVIQDDVARPTVLEDAGARKARAIVLCTQNDSLNLQAALIARRLNPKIHVVVRIFDDDFAQALHDNFGFIAMSATGMAAPAFAAAGAGVEMTRPITIEGQPMSLARLNVNPGSSLAQMNVGELEGKYEVSVVLLKRADDPDLHPAADCRLVEGDVLAVLGGPSEIGLLTRANGAAP